MQRQQNPGKERALQKIKHYCAYQERSHKDVKEKLYSFGLRKAEVEELMANLIENNYLNEERFATLFAGGKFRLKHWGRIKIQYELKQNQVSACNIDLALKCIDESEYMQTLKKLARQKKGTLKETNPLTVKLKTINYLLQKGYERNLAEQVLKDLVEP